MPNTLYRFLNEITEILYTVSFVLHQSGLENPLRPFKKMSKFFGVPTEMGQLVSAYKLHK
jgi:hypothetical protein